MPIPYRDGPQSPGRNGHALADPKRIHSISILQLYVTVETTNYQLNASLRCCKILT